MSERFTGRQFVARLTAVAVVALGAWAGVVVAGRWSDRTVFAGYPELRSADGGLGRRASDALSSRRFKTWNPDEWSAFSAMDADVEAASLSILRDLVAVARRNLGRGPILMIGNVTDDDRLDRNTAWIREHPSATADAVLVRMANDRSLGAWTRKKAVIGLARPGNAAGLEALAEIACDVRDDANLRLDILLRLSRFEAEPPARLRPLLDLPWFPGPSVVASSLLAAGDAQAPSLVAESLRLFAPDRTPGEWGWIAAKGLERLVSDDATLSERLARAAKECLRYHADDSAELSAFRSELALLADDVDAWLARHPEATDTAFERSRREYLASDRRRRELATPDIAQITGDDFGLGAALLRTDARAAWGEMLERLDRLAALVRRDAGDAPTTARWIETMNARLFASPRARMGVGSESKLDAVLWGAGGNCMGSSSLYLAVAERLGLPIRGVNAPNHVFVRWDDGITRRNIECTEGGAEHADAWYETRGDGLSIAPADVASGAYLGNLPKSRFVALALVNRTNSLLATADFGLALRTAETAVRLAPNELMARLARAHVLLLGDTGRAADALADLTAAETSRRPSLGEARLMSSLFLRGGDPAAALRLADRAVEFAPADAETRLLRARALARLGRVRDAERELGAVETSEPAAQLARIELALAQPGSGWRELLAREAPAPTRAFTLHLELATELLDGIAARPPSAGDARFVLGRISSVDPAGAAKRPARSVDSRSDEELNDALSEEAMGHPRRRAYFRLLARCCRLEGDEAGAATAEAASAKR